MILERNETKNLEFARICVVLYLGRQVGKSQGRLRFSRRTALRTEFSGMGLYVKPERKTPFSVTVSRGQGFRSCILLGANVGVAIWIMGVVLAVTRVRLINISQKAGTFF